MKRILEYVDCGNLLNCYNLKKLWLPFILIYGNCNPCEVEILEACLFHVEN